MKVFYIDTSSSYLYAGISDNDILLSSVKKKLGSDMSKFTIKEVENLFKEASLEPGDIDKIIVVKGPGSYTGIRIGMTFAKIMAWSLKKEIVSITSLDAMSVIETLKVIVPLIDARRGFVFAGIYENNNVIMKNQYLKLDRLKEQLASLKKDYVYIGNQNKFKLENFMEYDPDILKIIIKYEGLKGENPHTIEPEYLKLTEAEENLKGIHYDN